MRLELCYSLESWKIRCAFIYFPDITFPLKKVAYDSFPKEKTNESGDISGYKGQKGKNTLLLPATKQVPSDAIVTERIGTSPAGA